MHKTPSLFLRHAEHMNFLTHEPNPVAAWVFAREGVATRKYDGTCMWLDPEYSWWMRREVKPGRDIPAGFLQLSEDPNTGKVMGWVPASPRGYLHPLLEALDVAGENEEISIQDRLRAASQELPTGTYELCGPKVNGNPEGYESHRLIRHADADQVLPDYFEDEQGEITFDSVSSGVVRLRDQFGWEGIVWHHPDGRKVKIKARDFDKIWED